jgi:putative addiction module killer protein
MPCRVEEYVHADGSVPYRKWFDSLPADAAAKVAVAVTRLSLGNTSSVKWFSGIGEYRIDWGPGYRVYLAKDGEALIVLYGGGTKKSQPKDIERALALHAEYKARRAAAKQRAKKTPRRR